MDACAGTGRIGNKKKHIHWSMGADRISVGYTGSKATFPHPYTKKKNKSRKTTERERTGR